MILELPSKVKFTSLISPVSLRNDTVLCKIKIEVKKFHDGVPLLCIERKSYVKLASLFDLPKYAIAMHIIFVSITQNIRICYKMSKIVEKNVF